MSTILTAMILPKGTLDYFDPIHVEQVEGGVIIHLEEKNILPEGYSADDYECKDFLPSKGVQDFPIRGQGVLLEIVRRRWRHKTTGKTITRDWKVVMDGGLVTQEFADFLKGID